MTVSNRTSGRNRSQTSLAESAGASFSCLHGLADVDKWVHVLLALGLSIYRCLLLGIDFRVHHRYTNICIQRLYPSFSFDTQIDRVSMIETFRTVRPVRPENYAESKLKSFKYWLGKQKKNTKKILEGEKKFFGVILVYSLKSSAPMTHAINRSSTRTVGP